MAAYSKTDACSRYPQRIDVNGNSRTFTITSSIFLTNPSWLAAVRTLAVLGQISPKDIGLYNFSSHTNYFQRQIKSLSYISSKQAETVDIDTKKPVGDIPYFNDLIKWYKANYPDESKIGTRIVHGDYKIDNLVYHPSENRVIGILDWELCTLGNPVCLFYPRNEGWMADLMHVACRPGEYDPPVVG